MNDPIAIIILAAGASSRLGRPKQLLTYDGKPLLERMAGIAIESGCHPVIVVLGAHLEKIRPVVEHLPVQILKNKKWETGMGSTVVCGMTHLTQHYPDTQAVILMVGDQPFLDQNLLQQLIEKWKTGKASIVASQYGQTTGVPALFAASMFPELLALNDSGGARKLIRSHADEIAIIPFEKGHIDLDTEEDVRRFLKN